MEFHIRIVGPVPDLAAIEQAIGTVDPAVLVDVDPAGTMVRVAASIDATQLLGLLGRAGWPVAGPQVTQVASICCGGCSG